MDTLQERIDANNWASLSRELHDNGFVTAGGLLTSAECEALKALYDADKLYRKTVNMERYKFGKGEYKYFQYPLPPMIAALREMIYPRLVPVANQWMEELKESTRFPSRFGEMQQGCHEHGQTKPAALMLKYAAGGFNTLHQDLYGEVWFPIQVVFLLSQAGEDYTGGEFVITEQIPRAQSKANVLSPGRGDGLIFATNFRPVKGSKGYYRVNMRHGVSPVHTGKRSSLGIIFHDALS